MKKELISRLDLKEYGNRYQGCCPIHGGDNPTSFVLYKNGVWQCFTHLCHNTWGCTFKGLRRALNLSNDEIDFEMPEPRYDDIILVDEELKKLIPRDKVRSSFSELPATYYLDRNYSYDIIDKYDVGYCNTPGKMMYRRAVVPVYSIDHQFAIGFTGRDTTNKSKEKWIHSKGFKKSSYLYNSWYAKDYIFDTKTAIIVESPGNVWRLEEAGIHCSIATLGCSISRTQKRILSRMGIMNIVYLKDKGAAGELGAEKIKKELSNLYKLYIPDLDYKDDIGSMSVDWVLNNIEPIIRKII